MKDSGGIGIPTILFLIFLVLKLTGYIAWSWWWVFSPLWLSAILILASIGICLALFMLKDK